jgi:hypothetical protein
MRSTPIQKFIIVVLTLLVAVGVIVAVSFKKESPAEIFNGDPASPQTFPPPDIPAQKRISVGDVEVENFIREAEVVNARGDLSLASGEGYAILYFPESKSFTISILSSPFETYKEAAEREFVELLGTGTSELCRLDVAITTPRFANPEEAGSVYGLSFCRQ